MVGADQRHRDDSDLRRSEAPKLLPKLGFELVTRGENTTHRSEGVNQWTSGSTVKFWAIVNQVSR